MRSKMFNHDRSSGGFEQCERRQIQSAIGAERKLLEILKKRFLSLARANLLLTLLFFQRLARAFLRSAIRRLISAGLYFFGVPFASLPSALAFRFILPGLR